MCDRVSVYLFLFIYLQTFEHVFFPFLCCIKASLYATVREKRTSVQVHSSPHSHESAQGVCILCVCILRVYSVCVCVKGACVCVVCICSVCVQCSALTYRKDPSADTACALFCLLCFCAYLLLCLLQKQCCDVPFVTLTGGHDAVHMRIPVNSNDNIDSVCSFARKGFFLFITGEWNGFWSCADCWLCGRFQRIFFQFLRSSFCEVK